MNICDPVCSLGVYETKIKKAGEQTDKLKL